MGFQAAGPDISTLPQRSGACVMKTQAPICATPLFYYQIASSNRMVKVDVMLDIIDLSLYPLDRFLYRATITIMERILAWVVAGRH